MNTLRGSRAHPLHQWLIVLGLGMSVGLLAIWLQRLESKWMILGVGAVAVVCVSAMVWDVKKVLLALIVLDIPFPLDIYFGYRRELAGMGAIVGYGVSVTTICLAVLYGVWIVELLTKQRMLKPGFGRACLPLFAYLMFAALSVLAARDVTFAYYELFTLAQMFLLFVYIVGNVETRAEITFIFIFLMAGLALESLVMHYLMATGKTFNVLSITGRVITGEGAAGAFTRVGGTMGSPIIAATYLELLLAPALGLALTKPAPWIRNLALAAFALGAVALVFTYSRAAWGGFVLSLGFFCWFAWQRRLLPKIAPTLIVSSVLILFAVFFTPITARIFGPDMGSAESRLPLMDLAFRMIQDHPLLGVGANNFGVAVYDYLTPEFSGDFLWAVHNKYLLVFAETGIGGFLAYILFLLVTVKRGWQVWRKAEPALALIGLALTAAVLGQMLHMFVDVFHGRPQVQLLWLVAALISSMHLQLGRKNES